MQENDAAFLKFLAETQRIDSNGRLDLEAFCFHFSQCLSLDGLSDSIRARDLCTLMATLVINETSPPVGVKFIQQFSFTEWQDDWACIYPERRRTIIHVGALIIVWDKWLEKLGGLMGVDSEVWFAVRAHTHKVSWLLPEHQFTYALFRKVDLELAAWMDTMNASITKERGYSPAEALELAIETDQGLDEMKRLLKALSQQNPGQSDVPSP
jgi:hypothetical protein